MKARAIWAAYADVGALDVACPNCGAAPRVWCTNEVTGRVRRAPCIARTASTGAIEADKYGRDPSAPDHPPEPDVLC